MRWTDFFPEGSSLQELYPISQGLVSSKLKVQPDEQTHGLGIKTEVKELSMLMVAQKNDISTKLG